jgi:hypothetical protein
MPWVKIDDHFDEHPKLAAVGPVGWGVWLAGLAYCNRNLTDGFIPHAIAEGIGGAWLIRTTEDQVDDTGGEFTGECVWHIARTSGMSGDDMNSQWVVELLVSNGLWSRTRGGYLIHDYAEYQPTKAEIIEERAKKAAAGQAGGLAAARARATAPVKAPAVAQSKPVPVPVPVPVPPSSSYEDSGDTRADVLGDRDEPEWPVLAWLGVHKATVTPNGGGLHRIVISLAEKHGASKVIQTMAALGDDLRPNQYVLGADNALNPIPSARRETPADARKREIEDAKAEADRRIAANA